MTLVDGWAGESCEIWGDAKIAGFGDSEFCGILRMGLDACMGKEGDGGDGGLGAWE